MKVAILYICTGKYSIFWNDFYKSSEDNFLLNSEKEYFLFTDGNIKAHNKKIHIIFQEKLGWPYDTLMRFKMFDSIKDRLRAFDYIFFINANMRFLVKIEEDFLPLDEGLIAVKHPGFFNKLRAEFTYETNPASLAFIDSKEGENYFMGGFNGGKADEYLQLINTLRQNVQADLENGIIALWHDESHLNKYLLNKKVKIMNPAYGYPEGWQLPFEKKVIILDKTKYGGHSYLRGNKTGLIKTINIFFQKLMR